jgi:hypothetical protein
MSNYTPVTAETSLYAGSNMTLIAVFGIVAITVKLDGNKTKTVTLQDVALVPSFHTSVVFLHWFEAIGGAWNSRDKYLTY